MNLIIVESPTKARTLSGFLGKNYKIESSYGHIRDLPKSNKKAIDIPAGFVPRYEIIKGKEKTVQGIEEIAKESDEVLLATDPDREGEAIAWHIVQACGLNETKNESASRRTKIKNVKRIVFHEITQSAIEEAIKHPREIDANLVKAQEARRVLDRLVGYDLSGLIWKKVRYGLSAGRVQSPALRIIMEKEREIRAFVPQNYWVITGEFSVQNGEAGEKLVLTCEEKPIDEKEANRISEIGRGNQWRVVEIKQSEARRSPKPPFTTSTLQQAASSRLGFAPSRTMFVAQKLYEQGFITYMRTDSVTVSKEALPAIYKEIEKTCGKEYLEPRFYKTKSKNAQEAHEAVRPTNIGQESAGTTDEQKKLYKLIRERMLASQMADAKILKTKVSANIVKRSESANTSESANKSEFADNPIPNFFVVGNVIIFDGWLAADAESRNEEVQLPKLSEGQALKLLNLESQAKQTEPPDRYTEAGLVKELEKREIGRPSTYASIIKTIQDRGYVVKEGRTLRPTDTGEVVNDFLENNFGNYISDSFTAEMENELDEIAEGKRKYEAMLKNFYTPFSREVKAKEKTAGKITNLGEAGEEHKCPACGGPMVIKLARTGKFLSCVKFPECSGARKINGSIMEGPKETGEDCPQCQKGKLVEREGKFGKFISCSNYPKCKFIKQSAEQEAKAKTGVKCLNCKDGEIVERRGRFGPFYSCSNYPECKFIMKSRPTGNVCKSCGSLMMQGTKTIPERCSNKNCPNYNPHKMK